MSWSPSVAAWEDLQEELTAVTKERDELKESLDKSIDKINEAQREFSRTLDELKGRYTQLSCDNVETNNTLREQITSKAELKVKLERAVRDLKEVSFHCIKTSSRPTVHEVHMMINKTLNSLREG